MTVAAAGLSKFWRDHYIQALRGLAIAAVVLIHCLPGSAASVALRPFLNWAVAMFLFLSGLLTTEERVARGVSLWFCQPLVRFRHAAARPAVRALSQVVSRAARCSVPTRCLHPGDDR